MGLRARAGVGVAAVALVAAGCGGGDSGPRSNGVADEQPAQILTDAKAAAKAARSLRVSGSVNDRSDRTDLDLRVKGTEGATGTLSSKGVRFEVVRVGDDVYLRTDRAGYVKLAGARGAELIGDRWLRTGPTDARFSSFEELTNRDKLIDGLLSPRGTLTKGEATTVRGTPAITLRSADDKGTLAVATTGPPYPLRLASGPRSDSSGEIDFAEWNAPVTLRPPPPDQVLDTSKLR